MSLQDLETAILDNWTDLDAATFHAQRIEDTIMSALNEASRKWADEHEWDGVFNYPTSFWLAPPCWLTASGSRPNADVWFQLESEDDGDDSYYLTCLTGRGRGRTLLKLKQHGRMQSRDWKALVAAHAGDLPDFQLSNDPALGLPVQLDFTLIAGALHGGGSYTALLEPFAAALDRLADVTPLIDSWLPRRKAI